MKVEIKKLMNYLDQYYVSGNKDDKVSLKVVQSAFPAYDKDDLEKNLKVIVRATDGLRYQKESLIGLCGMERYIKLCLDQNLVENTESPVSLSLDQMAIDLGEELYYNNGNRVDKSEIEKCIIKYLSNNPKYIFSDNSLAFYTFNIK